MRHESNKKNMNDEDFPLLSVIKNLVDKNNKLKSTINDLENENKRLKERALALNGKKWYWFNCVGGIQWRSYNDADCQKLNVAWINNEESCLVVNGDYRVEFNRSNTSKPGGN